MFLVAGGYGQVGGYAVRELAGRHPGQVIVAGRSLDKATRLAAEVGAGVHAVTLDIYDPATWDAAMADARTVVMCLNSATTDFAQHCLQRGIHYVDISPSQAVMRGIERFDEVAQHAGATAALGVGLAPGLSNLLVKQVCEQFDEPPRVQINMMLGLGEAHGTDGVRWFLDNISDDFPVPTADGKRLARPFAGRRVANFPAPWGRRSVYRFNVADQFITPNTLPVAAAGSYFCYDSRAATRTLGLLKRLGVFRMLRSERIYRLAVRTLASSVGGGLGTDAYALQVEATGLRGDVMQTTSIGVAGNDNSRLTAQIAAVTAEALNAGKHPAGVHYLEQLITVADLRALGAWPV
ncbi:MAG: saccharopine dehydrogenase NADP-binding domain-containing protein [Promicromonosporaceae bacterium]|nr:saccharopine dehydrogenase NADP-binding domain-containing protein [Promicromonosporaceae bacterium]